MAKTDIASAFRIIPIHPCDFHLLGMKWQGKYFFDRCLPMGCSTSCSIFESFSTALEQSAKKVLGSQAIIHILDDFFIVASTESACRKQLHKFLALCDDLGVPIAEGKTFGPLTTLHDQFGESRTFEFAFEFEFEVDFELDFELKIELDMS